MNDYDVKRVDVITVIKNDPDLHLDKMDFIKLSTVKKTITPRTKGSSNFTGFIKKLKRKGWGPANRSWEDTSLTLNDQNGHCYVTAHYTEYYVNGKQVSLDDLKRVANHFDIDIYKVGNSKENLIGGKWVPLHKFLEQGFKKLNYTGNQDYNLNNCNYNNTLNDISKIIEYVSKELKDDKHLITRYVELSKNTKSTDNGMYVLLAKILKAATPKVDKFKDLHDEILETYPLLKNLNYEVDKDEVLWYINTKDNA